MINLNGLPLLTEEQCVEIFNSEEFLSGNSHIKPIYKHLPNFEYLSKNQIDNHIFKDLEPGKYLVGLTIIAENWVNSEFCEVLLEKLGLILEELKPLVKNGPRDSSKEDSFDEDSSFDEHLVIVDFKHIVYVGSNINKSLVS